MCRDPSMKPVVFTTILLLCLPFCLRVTEGSSSFLYMAVPTTLGYVGSWLGTTLSYPTSFPLFSSSSSAAGLFSSVGSSCIRNGNGFSSGSCDQHDEPFKTMIKHTDYGRLGKADVKIEIYINRKGYHWFLLAKLKKSSFSLISFEITSSNMGYNLIRYMRFNESLEGSERVGIYSGSFMQLCDIADDVITEMESYSLFTRNCQHFCNNLLARLGLRHDYPTTIGPATTISKSYTTTTEADNDKFIHPTRLEEVYQTLFSDRGGIVGAALVANMLTAPKLGKNLF